MFRISLLERLVRDKSVHVPGARSLIGSSSREKKNLPIYLAGFGSVWRLSCAPPSRTQAYELFIPVHAGGGEGVFRILVRIPPPGQLEPIPISVMIISKPLENVFLNMPYAN